MTDEKDINTSGDRRFLNTVFAVRELAARASVDHTFTVLLTLGTDELQEFPEMIEELLEELAEKEPEFAHVPANMPEWQCASGLGGQADLTTLWGRSVGVVIDDKPFNLIWDQVRDLTDTVLNEELVLEPIISE